MKDQIKIIRNEDSEKQFGVENINYGYKIEDGYEKSTCKIEIICELKFIEDKKSAKKSVRFAFSIIDDQNRLVGAGFEYIYEKKKFFTEDIFVVQIDCNVSKQKVNAIKTYISER